MFNKLSFSFLLSVGAHLAVLSALFYFSSAASTVVGELEEPMRVVMYDINTSVAKVENISDEIVDIESVVETEPVSEPEERVEPEPEAIPLKVIEEEKKPEEKKPEEKPKEKPKEKKKKEIKKQPINKVEAVKQTSLLSGEEKVNRAINSGVGADINAKPRRLNGQRPVYPSKARIAGIEGEVKLSFDVNSHGEVVNIRILYEKPRNMFKQSVLRAMKSWHYEANKPKKDLEVTVVFKIDGNAIIRG